jgi:hypothetical protein
MDSIIVSYFWTGLTGHMGFVLFFASAKAKSVYDREGWIKEYPRYAFENDLSIQSENIFHLI